MLSTGLGLVFGVWFGFHVTHSPRFYTRQGQIKDDVERTLRYWLPTSVIRIKERRHFLQLAHVHGASWCIMHVCVGAVTNA